MAIYSRRLKSDTSALLGEVRFSFVNVFTPRKSEDGSDPKYSCCVLIPKKDKETLRVFEEAFEAAKLAGKSSKWDGRIPPKVTLPLHDGDEDRPEDPNFEGMMYFNCSSKSAPEVKVKEGSDMLDALDDNDFYSGCWGVVSINMFPYKSSGNVGVGVGLNNVMKTRDDEKLSGRTSAAADFAGLW